MRSIFRTIALLTLLLGLTSCRMDSLYIQIPGTNWSIEQGNQRLMVHFGDERFASIQRNNETGGLQVNNGTYTTKGHSVAVTADHDGSIHKLVRTFSHLKNSSNKNFSSLWPEAPETMENTVWTTILNNDFLLLYFTADGKVKKAVFRNVVREEGVPYGWSRTEATYALAGNQLAMGDESGTVFPEVMLVEDLFYYHFPVNPDTGCSDLKGTFWTYQTASYPGIIVFDTNSSFTRVLLSNNYQYQVSRGTYRREGNVLTLAMDDKEEACAFDGNSFTFLERTYDSFE